MLRSSHVLQRSRSPRVHTLPADATERASMTGSLWEATRVWLPLALPAAAVVWLGRCITRYVHPEAAVDRPGCLASPVTRQRLILSTIVQHFSKRAGPWAGEGLGVVCVRTCDLPRQEMARFYCKYISPVFPLHQLRETLVRTKAAISKMASRHTGSRSTHACPAGTFPSTWMKDILMVWEFEQQQ